MNRVDREPLRDTLLAHHPIARTETGLLTGCRCGQVQLGEDVIQHVMEKLLDGPLAPWIGAAFAVNRVEALADRWAIDSDPDDANDDYGAGWDAAERQCAFDLRRALDGDGQPTTEESR